MPARQCLTGFRKKHSPIYYGLSGLAAGSGFDMPGDIPYQVQLPPGAVVPAGPDTAATVTHSNDPWYTSLWKTIADTPHGAPPVIAPPAAPTTPGEVPPPPPGPAEPAPVQPGG